MQSEKIIKMQLEERKNILKTIKEQEYIQKDKLMCFTEGYIAALEFVLSENKINCLTFTDDFRPFKIK